MRPTAVPSSGGKRSWVLEFDNQWPAVLRPWRYNWIDFTLFHFAYEHERMMGNAHEITFGILGLNWRFAVNFRRSEKLNRMISDLDQLKAGLRDGKSDKELGLVSLDDLIDEDEA